MFIGDPLFAAGRKTDQNYFKLHQATGFLEQYIAKRCPSGKTRAQKLLQSLNRLEMRPELAEKAKQLKELIQGSPSVSDLEVFRLSLHDLQTHLQLEHSSRWHDEIVEQCKFAQS
jgi:hypothetical protein